MRILIYAVQLAGLLIKRTGKGGEYKRIGAYKWFRNRPQETQAFEQANLASRTNFTARVSALAQEYAQAKTDYLAEIAAITSPRDVDEYVSDTSYPTTSTNSHIDIDTQAKRDSLTELITAAFIQHLDKCTSDTPSTTASQNPHVDIDTGAKTDFAQDDHESTSDTPSTTTPPNTHAQADTDIFAHVIEATDNKPRWCFIDLV